MAENPTSSSTMYTTLGAPSGALGGSNGVQSGTESRMSTLIVPLNGSPTAHSFHPAALKPGADHIGHSAMPADFQPRHATGKHLREGHAKPRQPKARGHSHDDKRHAHLDTAHHPRRVTEAAPRSSTISS